MEVVYLSFTHRSLLSLQVYLDKELMFCLYYSVFLFVLLSVYHGHRLVSI